MTTNPLICMIDGIGAEAGRGGYLREARKPGETSVPNSSVDWGERTRTAKVAGMGQEVAVGVAAVAGIVGADSPAAAHTDHRPDERLIELLTPGSPRIGASRASTLLLRKRGSSLATASAHC